MQICMLNVLFCCSALPNAVWVRRCVRCSVWLTRASRPMSVWSISGQQPCSSARANVTSVCPSVQTTLKVRGQSSLPAVSCFNNNRERLYSSYKIVILKRWKDLICWTLFYIFIWSFIWNFQILKLVKLFLTRILRFLSLSCQYNSWKISLTDVND